MSLRQGQKTQRRRKALSKILLVGGGGREDAVARKIVESGGELFSALKNRNPSILGLSRDHLIVDELDNDRIVEFAVSKGIELAFIGPDPVLDTPLEEKLSKKGILVASPTRAAARLETSKSYMRDLLSRHKITGNIYSKLFTEKADLQSFLSREKRDFAIKPTGLTGGKGVKVMGVQLRNAAEALSYATQILDHDGEVLLEERITGEEFSLQVFTDGSRVAATPLAQDFKRAYEHDEGPNTGGMGSITDSNGLLPFIPGTSYESALSVMQQIAVSMKKDGNPFRGVMYGQFMETADGPKVIEVNARFADPESMNILSLFRGDFVELLYSIAEGNLKPNFSFLKAASVLKYLVPRGYGTKSEPGSLAVDLKSMPPDIMLYYAAVSGTKEKVEMSASRSLALVGIAPTIEEASDKVEQNLNRIKGDYYIRHDIGSKQMMEEKMRRFRGT